MLLLDTHVISELRSGKPMRDASVCAWAERQVAAHLYVSAITVLELEIGVRLVERKDAAQGTVLRAWCNGVIKAFGGRVLPFSGSTALLCAPMHVPDKKPFRDAMIGATAMEHGFALVTRNVADFQWAGLRVVNPWNPIDSA